MCHLLSLLEYLLCSPVRSLLGYPRPNPPVFLPSSRRFSRPVNPVLFQPGSQLVSLLDSLRLNPLVSPALSRPHNLRECQLLNLLVSLLVSLLLSPREVQLDSRRVSQR